MAIPYKRGARHTPVRLQGANLTGIAHFGEIDKCKWRRWPAATGVAWSLLLRADRGTYATRDATEAAWAGFTRTAPANSLPRSAGTTSTYSPGWGAWIIHPFPR
jgi:hypothetical protein